MKNHFQQMKQKLIFWLVLDCIYAKPKQAAEKLEVQILLSFSTKWTSCYTVITVGIIRAIKQQEKGYGSSLINDMAFSSP